MSNFKRAICSLYLVEIVRSFYHFSRFLTGVERKGDRRLGFDIEKEYGNKRNFEYSFHHDSHDPIAIPAMRTGL